MLLVAAAAVAVALLSGSHRRGALVGAGTSSLTALASLFMMDRAARAPGKQLHRALAVMVVWFLVRIVLVAFGTAAVWRAGESIFGFIVAFFVPYFIFAAIEGAYLHAASRGTGPTA
jgi:hypothetical protein